MAGCCVFLGSYAIDLKPEDLRMKLLASLAIFLAVFLVFRAKGAESAAFDPLTKLPLPSGTAALVLENNPNRIDDVPVCRSNGTMNLYMPRSGTVGAALRWYADHLPGFIHVHGFGSGRSQDTFYNSAGTLLVSITGMPAKEGQDTDVYSVMYSSIQPGVESATIAGMNIQKVVCPK